MSDYVAGACVFAAGTIFGVAVYTLIPVIQQTISNAN